MHPGRQAAKRSRQQTQQAGYGSENNPVKWQAGRVQYMLIHAYIISRHPESAGRQCRQRRQAESRGRNGRNENPGRHLERNVKSRQVP